MALFDNGLKGNIVTGLAIGIGTALFAPQVIPALAGVVKPLAKAAIKGSLVLYEKSKEAVAEVGEMMEDIVAEVKAEMAESHNHEAGINAKDETGA
jgi:hypothetical protein